MIMHSGSSLTSNNPAFSISIGIASLVLEGRPLSDDDYALEYESSVQHTRCDVNSGAQALPIATTIQSIRTSHQMQTDTVQHVQRLRQKLLQLRSAPGTSRDFVVDQSISVLSSSATTSYDSDEELETIYKKQQQLQEENLLHSLQSLASNCLKSTPKSFNKSHGLFRTVEAWTTEQSKQLGASLTAQFTAANSAKRKSDKGIKKTGPHCEQFMKKIGLIKSASGGADAVDLEEHFCSAKNETCFRWQIHYKQLASVFSRNDPICIEVYLGPENHVILLEQWIIQLCDKSTQMTMTLQSLCSAIRSQLYFSQITAWSDLLKTSSHNDSEIQSNPRIKHFAFKHPKLDILYRIRPYDTTACFKSKPNVHNFPDAIISENLTVKVCLKSLPRLNEIPTLKDETPTIDAMKCLSQPMVVDDRLTHPCTEKGKHRCVFDDESVTDEMDASPSTHRDRQLQKYRKRMQRRDRKKRSDDAIDSDDFCAGPSTDQPMPSALLQRQDSINSIRLPLYSCLTSTSNSPINTAAHITKSTQTANIEKRSISTQTDIGDPPYPNCNFCGIEMQFVCWNCDTKVFDATDGNYPTTKHVDKASLLLQAIQRTPSRKQRAQRKNEANGRKEVSNMNSNTNNCHQSASDNKMCERSVCDSVGVEFSDCRLCKRQKTVHNYMSNNNLSNKNALNDALLNNKENEMDEETIADGNTTFYRRTMSESLGDSDDASNVQPYQRTSITKTELKMYRRAYSEDVLSCSCDDLAITKSSRPKQLDLLQVNSGLPMDNFIENQFNTPKNHKHPNPTNYTTNPLYISCREDDNRTESKNIDHNLLPKINLTSVFTISPKENDSTLETDSSPRYSDLPSATAFTFENISPVLSSTSICSATVVHKSFSAPTFPNHHSPALSPRFLKSAAILRRRSRHLSDRSSERSSIGSDEQLSDEELGCGLDNTFSPIISPTKTATKPFPKSYPFGRRSLLGSLEESLLQRRITPKFLVPGFKVLLGASGGFCPTQMTIPSVTCFYELSGQSLSTPYVCEIKMPRKGYSIPRTGTVQATLLNPLGMVVRMFVVPYDFRDMPSMCQTFIRQRILAFDENAEPGRNVKDLSACEQMKLLRYAIHLK
ncbi:Protein FAM214A [Pseudolycoriella hygida]|uniref:Protein FAM214A n=1 Tax=Pseudolycoriella hygida TaxID=35572 RepID=A0A9Q0S4M6_9DIPT|nr:Protein FAM214A [Pseudolycoriella hygida]